MTPRNWTTYVRVAKGAHQLALPHELAGGLGQTSLQDGVDGFGGGHRESHLVHRAISPCVREREGEGEREVGREVGRECV